MTAGSNRLDRGKVCWCPVSALIIMAVLAAPAAVSLTAPKALGQEFAPSGATDPDSGGPGLESQIERILRNQHTMTPADVQAELARLLEGDLTGVLPNIQAAGFQALAGAHERLAQAARLDQLDPASERKAQEQLDAAVAAYIKAGTIARENDDFASATEAYNRALSYRPNSPEALLGSARVLANSGGRPLQALERYQDYLKVTSRGTLTVYEPELYVEMGRVYASANLWHQALKSYRQALDNGVDTAEVAALLSSVYMALNKPAEAFEQAEKAIAKNPTQPSYYRVYAELLLGRNAYAEASARAAEGIRVARDRLASTPGDQTTLEILNECYGTQIRALQALISTNPSDLESRLALVDALEGQSEVFQLLMSHRALNVLRIAPEQDRSSVELLEAQIRLQQRLRHKDLKATCERLLRIQPDNSLAREVLSALETEGQPSGVSTMN